MVMQIKRTATPANPPPALAQGQLSVGMADSPPSLWVGVPTTVDPSGRKQVNTVATDATLTGAGTAAQPLSVVSAPTPTVQTFGASGTYTPSAGVRGIRVRMIAGGGGGGAQFTSLGSQHPPGGTSAFAGWTTGGGGGGFDGGAFSDVGGGGAGGGNGAGVQIVRTSGGTGGQGMSANIVIGLSGGVGGAGYFGGSGAYGSGGDGAGADGGNGFYVLTGTGGGAGEYVEFAMTAAQLGSSALVTVGAGGPAGAQAGPGLPGIVIVEEYY
jgi:hypothetical protein